MKKKLKILCIGNSFSVDTTKRAPEIAPALGITLTIGNLFVPGCPIDRHYEHIVIDTPAYNYYYNNGGEWMQTPDYKISDAIRSDDWDYISIQHGSSGGRSYIRPECYAHFPALVQAVKALAPAHTKIVFNITWPADPSHHHRDLRTHTGSQLSLMNNIIRITQELVTPTPNFHGTIPTGIAIQNARTAGLGSMTRDGYHLSKDLGRYLAALTFLCAISGICPTELIPDPNFPEQPVLIRAAQLAIERPNVVTVMTQE